MQSSGQCSIHNYTQTAVLFRDFQSCDESENKISNCRVTAQADCLDDSNSDNGFMIDHPVSGHFR